MRYFTITLALVALFSAGCACKKNTGCGQKTEKKQSCQETKQERSDAKSCS